MKEIEATGISRLMQLAGTRKKVLVFSAVFAAISSVLELVPYIVIYLVLQLLLADGSFSGNYSNIKELGLIAVALVIGRYVTLAIAVFLSHLAAYDILYNLRVQLIAHLGQLPMGFFTAQQTGKIKKMLYEDVEELEIFIAHHIPDLVSGIVIPLLTIVYLFTVNWALALIAIVPLPIAYALQRKAFAAGEAEDYRIEYHNSLEHMNGAIVEYVRGMPVVKVFNQTVESFGRLKAAAMAYKYFIEKITLRTAPAWGGFTVITASGFLFIIPFGMWFYLSGFIGISQLLLFLILGAGYLQPLVRLATFGGQLQHLLEGLKRVDQILDTSPLPAGAVDCHPKAFDISFESVSFSYDGKNDVLKRVSFAIEQGSTIALVGPSGSGKTTLVHLLLRMWDCSSGDIRIGGVSVRDLSNETLMQTVSFVSQDGFLFSDTLRENIRVGLPNVTDGDILRAAEAAQCMSFINKFPHGLDTIIGEGGQVHLSGGERQRVAMARIILKNSPVVVLDEATAYADAESEASIQKAFAYLMQGKTVIVIAHRLSTITDVDKIIVVNKGMIEEQGKHAELLANNGLYSSMWQTHTAAQNWTLSQGGKPC